MVKQTETICPQFARNLPTNCLSVFDHFVKLALKGLKHQGFLDFPITNIESLSPTILAVATAIILILPCFVWEVLFGKY